MATAGGNGPQAPHMRPCAPRRHVKWMGDNPPSLQTYFLGGWGCLWPSKRFWWWCIATKLEFFEGHAHSNSPKNYIRLLRGLLIIHSARRHGAKGLVWGTRGPFLPAAMVAHGCDGWCWPLEAYVRSINCRNSRNRLWKYFFNSSVDPIHFWHLRRQLKKKNLDLHTLLFSWFLCPVFYGIFVPFFIYVELMMSRVCPQQHKQQTNTTTMVMELLAPLAAWIQWIHAVRGAGGLAHSFSKAAVEGFS